MSTEEDNEEITIKACGGDRAKNLELIAAAIDRMFGDCTTRVFDVREIRKMKGYAEQLRIIADELRKPNG